MIEAIEPRITHKFDGIDFLNFDISPYADSYKDLTEESTIFYEGAFYTVKKIDERVDISSIECELMLDDLKADCFNADFQTKTLIEIITGLLLHTTGWICTNSAAIATQRTIQAENINILDVLLTCADTFGCAFQFDNFNKVINVVKYDIKIASGTYFTDELNLKDISFKGDSTDFCTRLIGYGKKNEDTGEYLTFASLNGGKNYVENYGYSNKIITKAFVDERFTDAVSLRDEAIERLKLLAYPQRSYECSVTDLAKINPEFKNILGISLYDIVTLIDRRRKTRINHRVMEYVEYPEKPENNVVTLSSVLSTITGTVSQINQIIENTGELKINGVTLNEFKRDIDSNSLAITKCYTKGQTDTAIVTGITQSVADGGSINLYVSKQSKLKSTTYSLPPDTYLLNDTFCPDKDYFTPTKTFKKGVNYIAVNSNDIPTQKLLRFSDGKVLKFTDGKCLVFPEIIADNWDKKDNYQTDKDVSASMTVKAGEIIQACQNGALSASTKFSAENGLEIFNGDLTVYDKPENDVTKKKVFGIDNDTGNLKMVGTVEANSGNIGGWTIHNDSLQYNFGFWLGSTLHGEGVIFQTDLGTEERNVSKIVVDPIDGCLVLSSYRYSECDGNHYDFVKVLSPLNVSGEVYANGFQVTSDRKLKKDIKQNTSYALDKLKGVNFYAYTLNKPIKDKDGNETGEFDNSYSTKIGLMHDECPDDIATIDDKGEKHIDLYASISLALKSIQELNKKIERQSLQISELRQENTEIKEQFKAERLKTIKMIKANFEKKGDK